MTKNIFAKHTQKANEWLKQVEDLAGSNSDSKKVFGCVTENASSIKSNLPIESVLHLSAQLPLIIKGILFENWHLSGLSSQR